MNLNDAAANVHARRGECRALLQQRLLDTGDDNRRRRKQPLDNVGQVGITRILGKRALAALSVASARFRHDRDYFVRRAVEMACANSDCMAAVMSPSVVTVKNIPVDAQLSMFGAIWFWNGAIQSLYQELVGSGRYAV
jgi:hypothetical protein